MNKLTLREVLKHDGDKVEIEIVGKEPDIEKTYNGITKSITPFKVLVAGQSYIWEANQDHKQKLIDNGCGRKFVVVAFKTAKGFIAHNFMPSNDVSLNFNKTKTVEPREFNEAGLGQALNLGSNYELYINCGGTLPLLEWFEKVKTNAITLAPLQKAFVSGTPVQTPTIENKEPKIDAPPVEAYKDFPF